ncbi:MAG: hypothetical protein ACFFC6_11040, partial [Promethearchaeota archaeon]
EVSWTFSPIRIPVGTIRTLFTLGHLTLKIEQNYQDIKLFLFDDWQNLLLLFLIKMKQLK